MRNLQSLRLLLADKDKEIERLNKMLDEKFMKENTFLVENGIICIKNKELERLKKELMEEKEAYIKMYNMYVEKDNVINEIKEYFEDLEIFAPSRDIKYDILDIIEGDDKE